MASILYVDVRKGMVVKRDDGQLYYCVDRELRTPGNLPSKLTLKLKNLKTGFVNEVRVHPEDKVEVAFLEKRAMEYSYKDADGYVFIDKKTYDQVTLPEDMVGSLMGFLKEGNDVQVTFHDGNPLSIDLPQTVQLQVKECDPSIKGATAKDQYKPAILETGLKVAVPPFIEKGEMIEVNTEDSTYVGRVKG